MASWVYSCNATDPLAGLMKTKEDFAILVSATFQRSVAPSPLPCTRGRGVGVRGLESLAKRDIFAPTMPPHPRPLSPEYRGEGRSKAQLNSDESSSAFSSAQSWSPNKRWSQ